MPVIRSRPSFKTFAGIALACGALALGACDRQSEGAGQPEESASPGKDNKESAFNGTLDISRRGDPIPDFNIALPDGTEKPLSGFAGKPLLLNLWATWCGPCVLEMPMLDELAARHDGNLTVLTVSQDFDGAEKVAPWFAERNFAKLEPWLDPQNDLGFHYGTGVLPTTILYDAEGKEVWRMIGGHDWSGARAEAMLADTMTAARAD